MPTSTFHVNVSRPITLQLLPHETLCSDSLLCAFLLLYEEVLATIRLKIKYKVDINVSNDGHSSYKKEISRTRFSST
ncbi:hypothetical protein QVD17_08825 [Tagetes erecta]|uniref:Uncharacterized protein n=1 Tax=Tagetes erecta TaxID=13708 RepID=A0AAD8KZV2_TARER|nr:hypothetical protein QVD17_08825 [Tagetes erecta]